MLRFVMTRLSNFSFLIYKKSPLIFLANLSFEFFLMKFSGSKSNETKCSLNKKVWETLA